MKSLLVTGMILIFSLAASAVSKLEPIPASKIDINSFIKSGAVSGGTAKAESVGPLSLLEFKKKPVSKNIEQLSLTLGDKNGGPLSEPGFYHVALDEDGTRLVLDLAQVQQTSVDQSDVKAILKTSSLIRSAEITMDPVDKSTNITFLMKRPVMAKASSSKVDGKVIIELQEAN